MSHPMDKDGDFLAKWIENDGHKSLSSTDENFDVLQDVKSIVKRVDNYKTPAIDRAKLFEKINFDISQSNISTPKTSRLYYLLPIVLCMGLGFLILNYINNSKQVSTPAGKHLQYKLPDNSEVVLNANTELAYNNDFKENRKLTLKGEAFFEVKKGSSFVVESDLGTVEVLGTSFNVNAQNDAFKVSCKTGKVKVTVRNSEYILKPGMEVIYYNKQTIENTVAVNTINQWENGLSSFEKTPMPMVVRSLVDWYGVDINFDSSLTSDKFSGNFVQDDLEKALKMVFLPMGLKYELKDDMVLIHK